MTEPTTHPRHRLAPPVAGLIAGLLTLALMLATEPFLAIVWDEGYTLGREDRVRAWFAALRDPAGFAARWTPPVPDLVQSDRNPLPVPRPDQIDTRAELFDPRTLAWFWPFAREEPHGHPPFYALVGLAGEWLVPTSWEPLARARLGPIGVFSLTVGCIVGFSARRWGAWPAALAAGAFVLQPRLFGHGHYAAYDALLTCLWVLAILAFWLAVEVDRRRPRWSWAVAFGLLLGCAADTKFTGWFLPLPFAAWAVLYRDRRGWLTLAVGAGVAAVVLYVLNPPFWFDPVVGVERFLRSNLTRGRTRPIPVLFLWRAVQTPNESLPWFNTLAWTLFVTPVGFLAFALAGAARSVWHWRSERFGMLVVGHWAFLLLLRALPHTPGHDGVRLFLPAFGCLALCAGLGAAGGARWLKLAVGASLAEAAASVALMMPVPLAYYSPIIGGLPGAAGVVGLEPTYYWDALTDDALDWLNDHTATGERVVFATYPHSFLYLQSVGRLRMPIQPNAPGRPAWYVLQNRPGALSPWDRALLRRGRPAYLVSKLGVPLVLIYPYTELERTAGPVR